MTEVTVISDGGHKGEELLGVPEFKETANPVRWNS